MRGRKECKIKIWLLHGGKENLLLTAVGDCILLLCFTDSVDYQNEEWEWISSLPKYQLPPMHTRHASSASPDTARVNSSPTQLDEQLMMALCFLCIFKQSWQAIWNEIMTYNTSKRKMFSHFQKWFLMDWYCLRWEFGMFSSLDWSMVFLQIMSTVHIICSQSCSQSVMIGSTYFQCYYLFQVSGWSGKGWYGHWRRKNWCIDIQT